jgi:DNA gyrase subunit A
MCCSLAIVAWPIRLRAYQVPEGISGGPGVPIVQMLPIPKEECITSVLAVREFTDEDYLVMLTRGGFVKKTALSAFSNIRTNGLIAISLEDGDHLASGCGWPEPPTAF